MYILIHKLFYIWAKIIERLENKDKFLNQKETGANPPSDRYTTW